MLPLTEKRHVTNGPKDLKFNTTSVMTIDIARTTNNTGEQIHIAVPVYSDDARKDVQDRLGFAYELIQERLEQENKAVHFTNERAEIVRRGNTIVEKNTRHLEQQLEVFAKQMKRGKMTEATFAEKRSELMTELGAANEAVIRDITHAQKEIEAGHELPRLADGEYGEVIPN